MVANPFYVQPANIGAGLQGLGQSLLKGRELREAEVEKQRLIDLRKETADIYATGTIDDMYQHMIKNPEIAETLSGAIQHKSEAAKTNLANSALSFMQDPSESNLNNIITARKAVRPKKG